jgi:hypothetical protein
VRVTEYRLWLQYFRYFRPHRALCGITAAGVAQSFAYIPLAGLLRHTFDVVLPAHDRSGLWITIGGLLALQICTLMLAWWTKMAALRVSQEVVSRLRQQAIRRMPMLSVDTHSPSIAIPSASRECWIAAFVARCGRNAGVNSPGMAVTLMRNCPIWLFRTDVLIWRCARIFSFYIRSTSRQPSTGAQFWNYAVLLRRSGSFHC